MARQRADSRKARKEVGDIPIPQDIADSICSCGGVEGLIESLPADDSIERMQRWYQACADPVRLKILSLLMVRPLCVCVIKAVLQMADSKLSYHLNILKKAGMIEGEQQGYYIIYNLTDQARVFLERERERLSSL
ncbi:MAG TPA: winged helix-turn-helix domain-containing protein [Methanoregulaceae archaeon]|nr:winged helix-turn-helix transcriptional regulator [Methanolinea sp.]MDD3090877.1 winged helix-turn-helix domain-containing protein [Methanoregulaceae archaeon]MDD5048648.1 winged helix-turn-helix domain-containing protein [Methanoregulaceae archaeon]HOP66974.1 winged helix-turn-helix domain-containing protein [Methanoregulaceae archaeon]HPJ74192.1 winged helix-turn-helix domain-containing protein [Methanoregulaceae archaeon]